jgi:hypothetical protein
MPCRLGRLPRLPLTLLALVVVSAACGLGNRWSEDEQARFHQWLSCGECSDGELAFIRDTLGDRAREPLREILLDMPAGYLERASEGLQASANDLPASVDRQAYVDFYLTRYQATLQRRAAVGLAALGDTAALGEAARRSGVLGYEADVEAVIAQALAALQAPGYDRAIPDTVVVVPDTRTFVIGDTAYLGATVRDASGNPVGGPIDWTSSDTSIVRVTSPRRGRAELHGRAVGTVVVTASAGSASSDATVEVVASPGPAPRLEMIAGHQQTDTAGTPLDVPLTVRVTDPSGAEMERVTVVFEIVRGPGIGTTVDALTNGSGEAAYTPVLGPSAEVMWVDATALGQRVRFRIRTRAP